MKTQPKPISIPHDLAARCVGPAQAERMDQIFRAVITTPHTAVVKDTAKRSPAPAKKRNLQ